MTRDEEIIQASEEWTYQMPPQYSELVHKTPKAMCAYQVGFIDGAVWADSTMIERACGWLRAELDKEEELHYIHVHGFDAERRKEFIEQFKIAMTNGFTSKTEVPT